MDAVASSRPQLSTADVSDWNPLSFWRWFHSFLVDEIAPYPGRVSIAARMTIAATLTMILIMTFRMPVAALAGYYTLVLSRQSPSTTLRGAISTFVAYCATAAYCLIGAMLFVDYPLTHFLWVVVSIFLCFFLMKVTNNSTGASAFAFAITVALPIWDHSKTIDALVTTTLWAMGGISVGLGISVAIEYIALLFEKRSELVRGLDNRLSVLSAYLGAEAQGTPDRAAERKIAQLAIVGVSRLRRLALEPASAHTTVSQRSTTVALVGRLIDICATIPHQTVPIDEEERARLRAVFDKINQIQICLTKDCTYPDQAAAHVLPAQFPLLPEIERSTDLLAVSLSPNVEDDDAIEPPKPKFVFKLVPDAFTNADHVAFALRGCLAASLCYVLYTAVAWTSIETSVTTCVLTAMSSIGASRQRQFLRIAGAIVGGIIFGIGSQVFITPRLDSLTGFTILFSLVSFVAAWFTTASPRLSYFGVQISLAFYITTLEEYYPQTDLDIARNRVVGIILGLTAMWFVFDKLGARSAIQVMTSTFAKNLTLLARLANPWQDAPDIDEKSIQGLRDQIAANFATVNAQGDGVLFEIGPSRDRDLRLRQELLKWQPLLRSLFLLQVAELHYRSIIKREDLPRAVVDARTAFDRESADLLVSLSEMISGTAAALIEDNLSASHERLERAIRTSYGDAVPPRSQAILALSERITDIQLTLRQAIDVRSAKM